MPGHWLLGDAARQPSEADRRPAAVLIAVSPEGADAVSLAELGRLADTDGLDVVGELTQSRKHPDPATYLGAGKADELAALVADRHADVVIADGELSPGQARNLEERTGARVVDRTALILDIFAEHARSNEGKAQVEPRNWRTGCPGCAGKGSRCPASVVAGWPVVPAWVCGAPVSSVWSWSGDGCASA